MDQCIPANFFFHFIEIPNIQPSSYLDISRFKRRLDLCFYRICLKSYLNLYNQYFLILSNERRFITYLRLVHFRLPQSFYCSLENQISCYLSVRWTVTTQKRKVTKSVKLFCKHIQSIVYVAGRRKKQGLTLAGMLLNELLVIQSGVCWRVYPDYPKNKSIHKVRVDAKSVADVNSFSLLSTVKSHV